MLSTSKRVRQSASQPASAALLCACICMCTPYIPHWSSIRAIYIHIRQIISTIYLSIYLLRCRLFTFAVRRRDRENEMLFYEHTGGKRRIFRCAHFLRRILQFDSSLLHFISIVGFARIKIVPMQFCTHSIYLQEIYICVSHSLSIVWVAQAKWAANECFTCTRIMCVCVYMCKPTILITGSSAFYSDGLHFNAIWQKHNKNWLMIFIWRHINIKHCTVSIKNAPRVLIFICICSTHISRTQIRIETDNIRTVETGEPSECAERYWSSRFVCAMLALKISIRIRGNNNII